MKKIVVLLCMAWAMLAPAMVSATSADSIVSPMVRSEQFVLDSLSLVNNRISMEQEQGMAYINYLDLVPILIPITFFLMMFAIVAVAVNASYKSKLGRFRVMEKAIEAGQPVPESLFGDDNKSNAKQCKSSSLRTMRVAIIMLSIGIGILLIGFQADSPSVLLPLSAIPILIGLGYGVVYFLEHREEQREREANGENDTTNEAC